MIYLKSIKQTNEHGFTLVELAVVMIIIGLLIGGILKGQELITNARVTKTAADMKAMGAAYNGFIDQYNAIPGDMSTATAKIGACATFAACANGNGNGIIGSRVGVRPLRNESVRFFGQLLAAGFISGMDGTNDGSNPGFGITNPTAPIGGGFLVGDTRQGAGPIGPMMQATYRPGVYILVSGAGSNPGFNVLAGRNSNGVLTISQAATIDRRLDDGLPQTGSIVADNGCDANSGLEYNEDFNRMCTIAYRM